MNRAHDMGGVDGFGPVVAEQNEPVFHADWERRAFALTLAMATPGGWNIDMSRFAREDRPASDYLSKNYYQIWLAGLERLMLERGLVAQDELAVGHTLHEAKANSPPLTSKDVAAVLRRGSPTGRRTNTKPIYAVGDRVRARKIDAKGHTRLPRYVQGHSGVVALLHGSHVFPDSNAQDAGEDPQWLYTVCFNGRELWGDKSDSKTVVSVDAWESYLERA